MCLDESIQFRVFAEGIVHRPLGVRIGIASQCLDDIKQEMGFAYSLSIACFVGRRVDVEMEVVVAGLVVQVDAHGVWIVETTSSIGACDGVQACCVEVCEEWDVVGAKVAYAVYICAMNDAEKVKARECRTVPFQVWKEDEALEWVRVLVQDPVLF